MDFNQHAYDLEFFNFTPEQISAERKHCVESIINKAIDTTIKKIETPATSVNLSAEKARVVERIQESCTQRLSSLKAMDMQTFHVPPHILQIHDFDVEHQFGLKDEEKKVAKLEQLKSRFRENMAMLAQLKVEEEKYASMEHIISMEKKMQQQIYANLENINCPKLIKFAEKVINKEKLEEEKEESSS